MRFEMMTLALLAAAAIGTVQPAMALVKLTANYTVLHNTDFPNNCANDTYGRGDSALDCAAQCAQRPDCAASIWNSNDGNGSQPESCAFKCRADNPIKNKPGIEAVVVRRGMNTCGEPPPPAPPPPPPQPVPSEWQAGYDEGSVLLSATAPAFTDQAAVLHDSTPLGNGLVGTIVDLQSVYLGGVFNTFVQLPTHGPPGWCPGLPGCSGAQMQSWRTNSSARASIPATSSSIALSDPANYTALDIRNAVYIARWVGIGPGGCLAAERRTFAPRINAPLLVTQLNFTSTCKTAVSVPLRTTFTGAIANLSATPDLDVHAVSSAVPGTASFAGTTKTAEPTCFGNWPGGSGEFTGQQRCIPGNPSARPQIAVVYDTVPTALSVAPGRRTITFISAYGSSHNHTAAPLAQAAMIYANARRLANNDELFAAHTRGMAAQWDAEQGGAVILARGSSLRLARGAWVALHALTSSMSDAWGGTTPLNTSFYVATHLTAI